MNKKLQKRLLKTSKFLQILIWAIVSIGFTTIYFITVDTIFGKILTCIIELIVLFLFGFMYFNLAKEIDNNKY